MKHNRYCGEEKQEKQHLNCANAVVTPLVLPISLKKAIKGLKRTSKWTQKCENTI